MNIHCSPNILCPSNLNFLHMKNYIRRAGIIPTMRYKNKKYVLLGLSNDPIPVWADLGGRAETNETTLQTCLREFNEESRHVLPININNIEHIIITSRHGYEKNPDQVILLIKTNPNSLTLNINQHFQNTIPRNQYEDEMKFLQWIPLAEFLTMTGITRSLTQVQLVLRNS